MEKVHVRVLNELGHEPLELSPEEVRNMIQLERGCYFVVNEETMSMVKELSFEPGQRIALIPIARGG